ncbi:MAG: hypothetical protein Q9183_003342 [Haloplaca sp. 2 TL-2023]
MPTLEALLTRGRSVEQATRESQEEVRRFSDFGQPRGGPFGREPSYVEETIILSSDSDEAAPNRLRPRRSYFKSKQTAGLKGRKSRTIGGTSLGSRKHLAGAMGIRSVRDNSLARQLSTSHRGSQERADITRTRPNVQVPRTLSPIADSLLDRLPRHNPFLLIGGVEEPQDDDHMFQADDIVARDTPQLVTARESGFFDTTVETGHEDAAVRVASGAVYFRWHVIEENDVRLLLVADRIHTKSPLYQVIRLMCVRHQSVFQNKAMSWFKRGVEAALLEIGGVEVFKAATTTQR